MKISALALAAAFALTLAAPAFAQTASPTVKAAIDCKKTENVKHADCVKAAQGVKATDKKS